MAQLIFTAENKRPIRNMPAHEHGCWEYILYMHSSGTLSTSEQCIAFKPGTIIKLPPSTRHWESSEKGYLNYAILFEDRQRKEGLSFLELADDHSAFRIAGLLHAVSSQQAFQPHPLCQALLDAFLISTEQSPGDKSQPSPIDMLVQNIRKNFHDPRLKISGLIKEAGFSMDHGRRLFKALTGKPPIQYLTELRVCHAQQLLSVGLSVKEAAYRSGFTDQLYFSRIFYKYAGIRPSQYPRAKK